MKSCALNLVSNCHTNEGERLEMSGDTPPRGFPHHLPPTVPAPGQYPQHRRPAAPSWAPGGVGGPFFGGNPGGGNRGGNTWGPSPVTNPAVCPPKVGNVIYGLQVFSGSPQSEGMDLSSTASSRVVDPAVHNGEQGGPINGQVKEGAVSVIAPNPLREEVRPCVGRDFPAQPAMAEEPPLPIPVALAQGHGVGEPAHSPKDRSGVNEAVDLAKPESPKETPVTAHSPPQQLGAAGEPAEGKLAPEVIEVPGSPPPRREPTPPLTQPQKELSPVKEEVTIKQDISPPRENFSPPRDSDSGEDTHSLKIVSPKDDPLSPEEEKKVVNGDDAVESLLENMFQGGGVESESKPPLQHSVIVTNSSHLTEDKVVAILEDKVEVKEETHDSMSSQSQEPMDVSTADPQGPLPTPDKKKFLEVEFELEKMFAGIEEDDKPVKGGDVEQSGETPPVVEKKRGRKPLGPKQKAKQAERKRKLKKDSIGGVPMGIPKTKRGSVGSGGQGRGQSASVDGSVGGMNRVRGPFVHIEGDRQNPEYVSVVNGGYRDEEERERGLNDSLQRRKTAKLKFVEGRVKGPDLYSSTLSARYNSQSADETWVCVFCKQRPHCERGLGGEPAGDLFGPYILNLSASGVGSESGVPSDQDVASEQKKRGGGKQLSLRAAGVADQFTASLAKKSKKSHAAQPPEAVGEKEVWVHEKCAVWAPGVLMVGSNLVGLPEAVSAALATKCSKCGEAGAGVGCVVGKCSNRSHYGCALLSSWSLDHSTFISRCPVHHLPSLTVK